MTQSDPYPKPTEEPKPSLLAGAIGVAVIGGMTLWHLAQPVVEAIRNN